MSEKIFCQKKFFEKKTNFWKFSKIWKFFEVPKFEYFPKVMCKTMFFAFRTHLIHRPFVYNATSCMMQQLLLRYQIPQYDRHHFPVTGIFKFSYVHNRLHNWIQFNNLKTSQQLHRSSLSSYHSQCNIRGFAKFNYE